jgi:hypothetical protein
VRVAAARVRCPLGRPRGGDASSLCRLNLYWRVFIGNTEVLERARIRSNGMRSDQC